METETVNLPTVQSFKYLGSTIYRRGGASKDAESRVAKAWSKWRELSGVICDKKVPTIMKLLIYQTVIRPTLLYGYETWPMSVKDEKRMATTEMRMVRWAMGVSLLEHQRREEILEEARVEPIATVMRRRRLEWFGHVKTRDETEHIRAVVEMKLEGERPRGRPRLQWKDNVRRELTAWTIREEWPLTGKDERSLQHPLPCTWRRRWESTYSDAVVGRHLLGSPNRRGALWHFTCRLIRHRYPKATSPQVPNVAKAWSWTRHPLAKFRPNHSFWNIQSPCSRGYRYPIV